jgi:outer membrane murein-binding lipoprotein Lpp
MLEREDKIDRLQQRISNLEGERDELRAERERLRAKVESLQEEKGSLADENDSLENQVQSLENDVDRLESEVSRLEDELETARAGGSAAAAAGETLTASQALSGTNLFVRYATKGESTLEDAHSGTATLEDVNENLRLEHHTNFEADDVAVDGRPYEEFLVGSLQFQFVDWAVRDLLFEIRNTGNQDGLRNLYDALPDVDRAELNGAVEIGQPDGDDETAEAGADIRFDVVLRDRMGNPLVVANVNDSRDAATEGMMVQLNEDAQAVKKRHDEFCSAFMVTTSFFEPGALETAAEATSGSLLSRDSRKSFVKLSRKRGYHLCLVETRSGNFHINVPEL